MKVYSKCIYCRRAILGKVLTQMQLTKQTDFAFRVLLYLGQNAGQNVGQSPEETLCNLRDICDYYDISQNHVAKVAVKLAKLGYIRSVRGHGGGIALLAKPQDINVAQVIRDFEPSLQPVNCTAPACKLLPNCKLKSVLFTAMNDFLSSASQYTLADLLPTQSRP